MTAEGGLRGKREGRRSQVGDGFVPIPPANAVAAKAATMMSASGQGGAIQAFTPAGG